jgi:hypothetical protein
MTVRTGADAIATIQFAFGMSNGVSSRVSALVGKIVNAVTASFRLVTNHHPSPTPGPTPDPSATPTPTPTATPTPPYRYAIIDLGKDVQPLRVNNKGWMLQQRADANGYWRYFRSKPGSAPETLVALAANDHFRVADMNDEGVAVGVEWRDTGGGVGLHWPAGSTIATEVLGPAAPDWRRDSTEMIQDTYFSGIDNAGNVYGGAYTGGGYMWFWYLDCHNIINAHRWPADLSAPVALSHSTSTVDYGGSPFFVFNWTGPMDSVSRVATGHYIGERITPAEPPVWVGGSTSGMVDGQSVDFSPVDINEMESPWGMRTRPGVPW